MFQIFLDDEIVSDTRRLWRLIKQQLTKDRVCSYDVTWDNYPIVIKNNSRTTSATIQLANIINPHYSWICSCQLFYSLKSNSNPQINTCGAINILSKCVQSNLICTQLRSFSAEDKARICLILVLIWGDLTMKKAESSAEYCWKALGQLDKG